MSVRVTLAHSAMVGGCSSCTRHITALGELTHPVWNVELRRSDDAQSFSFRLCAHCAVELRRELPHH